LLIRPFDDHDDLHELTALLHRAYAPLSVLGLNYTAVDQTVEMTRRRNASGQCLVAEDSDGIVGTILYTRRVDPCQCVEFTRMASIHQFAVEPLMQKNGIGRTLMTACEALALHDGETSLALDTAEPASHLVAAYSRWGFRTVSHVCWPGKVYRSVVMVKTLHERT
jgi:predicted N-acetyltransferase YhbS